VGAKVGGDLGGIEGGGVGGCGVEGRHKIFWDCDDCGFRTRAKAAFRGLLFLEEGGSGIVGLVTPHPPWCIPRVHSIQRVWVSVVYRLIYTNCRFWHLGPERKAGSQLTLPHYLILSGVSRNWVWIRGREGLHGAWSALS
jgi:hypothetical protein